MGGALKRALRSNSIKQRGNAKTATIRGIDVCISPYLQRDFGLCKHQRACIRLSKFNKYVESMYSFGSVYLSVGFVGPVQDATFGYFDDKNVVPKMVDASSIGSQIVAVPDDTLYNSSCMWVKSPLSVYQTLIH